MVIIHFDSVAFLRDILKQILVFKEVILKTTKKTKKSSLQTLMPTHPMWKSLIFILLMLSGAHASRGDSGHLKKLTADYPYGLLTDDFGILNKDDLKANACGVDAGPLSEDMFAYAYWQCFDVKTVHFGCDPLVYDSEEKTKMGLLVFSAQRDGKVHEYLARRPFSETSCRQYIKEWDRLSKNQDHVCVSGEIITIGSAKNNGDWSWVFNKYKTKNGCDSYFQHDCDNRYQLARSGCK